MHSLGMVLNIYFVVISGLKKPHVFSRIRDMNKKILYYFLAILAIAVLVGGVWYAKNKPQKSVGQTKLQSIERNFTDAQKKIYTDRIVKAEESSKNLKPQDPNFSNTQVNLYAYIAQQYSGLGNLQKSKEMY
jgi:hypothetical protein